MPIGGIRVDENTLGFAKEADDFLSLASAGLSCRDIPVFWRELSCDPERVQNFVICLIVKLIALDGGQGKLDLSRNYCEICGLEVDINSFKAWVSKDKHFDQERKHLSLLLQHQIIFTLYYLKQFYPHMPSNHLKNIHIRWNLARNCVRSENAERCDSFEVTVMKDYYRFGAEVPKVINPVDPHLLAEVLEMCCKYHRRGQLGYLPSSHSKLCNYRDVADSLVFYRLHFIVSGSQSSVCNAIADLVTVLKKCSADTADYGEKEILLPALQLLRQFMIEGVKYNTGDVYRAVQPFYLWPAPHCEVAKSLLDMIQTEDIRQGSMFREKLIAEHHFELNLNTSIDNSTATLNQRHYHHMLIDSHASRSYTFSQAFEKQEPVDPISVKKLFLRNVFYSLLKNVDLAKLDEQLEGMADQLDKFCNRAFYIIYSPETDTINGCSNGIVAMENRTAYIVKELDDLYSEIMSHPSEYLMAEQFRLTSQQLEDFSLPNPYIRTHSINELSTSSLKDKLKEIIATVTGRPFRHKKLSGRRTGNLPKSLSQDSGTVDHEYISSPDDVMSPKRKYSYPTRPSSAPSSRMHSVSEGNDHLEETVSVPTSPLLQCTSPTSPTSFGSSPQDLSDGLSASDHSEETASTNSNTSTSKSRSQSPASDIGIFMSSNSACHRGSIPEYGSGNKVNVSLMRRFTIANNYSDLKGITQNMTLERVRKKTHTFQRRKVSVVSQSTVTKVVKIVLAGDDKIVNNVASAYTELRVNEPCLFTGLQLQFYYVPLSEVSTATKTILNATTSSRRKPSDSVDHLIQPLVDGVQPSFYGEDVWLGCFVGNMDSWYERNVLLATHYLTHIIPSPEKASPSKNTPFSYNLPRVNEKLSPSPAQLIRTMVTNYCREAQNKIHFNMYSIELEVRPDKALSRHKTHHLTSQQCRRHHYMLQRLDIQRCVKGKQVKTFEAKLTVEESALDCTKLDRREFALKNIWSIGVASVPRIYDLHVNSPEYDNVEVTVTQATVEGKLTSAYKLSDENSYHVRCVEVEVKDKTTSVIINSDPSTIIDNVTRIKIQPAMTVGAGMEGSLMNSLSVNQQQNEKQVYFPLMSFWPVDL